MPEDFLVAHNPEPDSTLPYLIRVPLGADGIVLKAREMWPRTAKVYCHRSEWPAQAEIVERVPTRSCVKRGAAIDLVLDRGRENRSQFVLTFVRGREAIFWQTARTAKQARPNVRPPTARAGGRESLDIVVDSHERYAWKFADLPVTTLKRALVAGDYGVESAGRLVASVERKSLVDLVSTLTSGRMRYLLADLTALPRAAVVVEDRYSQVFAQTQVRPAVIAESLAECQARFPSVPIIFAETRALAQQWTYRFLAACLDELEAEVPASERVAALAGVPAPRRPVTTAAIRAWAQACGMTVSGRGKLKPEIVEAYQAEHS
ncbi:MAG: ERCC4 domain-containing protein [Micropruina sp.]